ncbi:hypothetical protein AMTR_s00029p00160290 [Amborella trichopoda]|uniref:Uncharacterized protein n=1 Tax=Amborella trichopoda TaxID=13333 RepID=W1PHT6_AMBTC|nr:hypothetical protein AMTR_s00029p00160290 [Amborella trichopoda]
MKGGVGSILFLLGTLWTKGDRAWVTFSLFDSRIFLLLETKGPILLLLRTKGGIGSILLVPFLYNFLSVCEGYGFHSPCSILLGRRKGVYNFLSTCVGHGFHSPSPWNERGNVFHSFITFFLHVEGVGSIFLGAILLETKGGVCSILLLLLEKKGGVSSILLLLGTKGGGFYSPSL